MTKWLNESHTTSKHQSDSCDCPAATSIPFLDTSCSIVNGVIKTDLYKKETDRNQYLLTSSCHPAHVTSNIPFSLALRIVRICSDPEDREQRFSELRSMLLARDYKSKIIDSCIEKARQIPRQEALNKVVRDKNNPDRMVFVIHYDPRLPSVPRITNRHYRTMVQDPYMKEVFPAPPLICYRRQRNIRDHLIRAKVPPPAPARPKRTLPGMKKCGKCVNCPYIKTGSIVKSSASTYKLELKEKFDCNTDNHIYLIECQVPRCNHIQYIGKTKDRVKDRFAAHRSDVNTQKNKSLPNHFNLPGHKVSDMKVTVIEKVYNKNPLFLREREKYYMIKYNTRHQNGLNKNSWANCNIFFKKISCFHCLKIESWFYHRYRKHFIFCWHWSSPDSHLKRYS